MYNIAISGINEMLIPLNKALKLLHIYPIESFQLKDKPEVRSLNEFKKDALMKMAEVMDKINNDRIQKTIEGSMSIKDQSTS